MIEVLKKQDWSNAFILPLTSLKKTADFDMKCYLFWGDYSIEDYKVILSLSNNDKSKLSEFCQKSVYPILDKKGYIIENYDIENRSLYILDMSEWAYDIEKFLKGKYSKFSQEAKKIIEKYHFFKKDHISVHIYSTLYPKEPLPLLGNKNAIEYVCEQYKLDYQEMMKIGEIGSIFVKESETLTL